MAVQYRAAIEEAEEGGFVVTFPDVPEALTQGDTLEEALNNAAHALETALEFYTDARLPLPAARSRKGHPIFLRPLAAAKLGIYQLMISRGVSKAELARMLEMHPPQIDRILSLSHSSKIEQLASAAAALGGAVRIEVPMIATGREPSATPAPRVAGAAKPKVKRVA